MRRKLVAGTIVLPVVAAVWFCWPPGSYNLNRVHSSVRELQTPYRSVWTSFYLDGGSIAVRIVDRDGKTVELAAPVGLERPVRHDYLFVGAINVNRTNRANLVEVLNPRDTMHMLAKIIDDRVPAGPMRDAALIAFRGAPKDYTRAYVRAFLEHYRRGW